ncbi:kazrin-like [Sinocyclocheilus anshuiensis]|uniref:kazrin-like n=1 Tax=Sinocyclocheilus anshuiensis TaxID=1608454 RepID=UPI0007B7D782|nr:PREDICTED: kazrin-like [Sinocyclocheilus anshuiensis]
MEDTLTCTPTTFSQVFGRQGQLMQATVQSLNSLNDQIAHFMVNRPNAMSHKEDTFLPTERDTLSQSMALMRHLLMDAQGKILKMMEDNKQLAQRIDGAIQSASQEVTNLRSELSATSRRLAELGACNPLGLENNQQNHHHHLHDPSVHHRQKAVVSDLTFQTGMSSLMDFGTPDSSLDKVLLREEVAQLQEEVHLLRQMKDMLSKDLEDSHGGCSADTLSAAELKVQLGEKEQELERAKEALQAMKGDRKRLKAEKADLVNQMQQLYTTLESREEQLRDFIRNYDQHRKVTCITSFVCVCVCVVFVPQAKQSLATLTKDVPKRHSLAMPSEPVVNGSQEWVMQADLPLTAAIRQSQQTLYHSHPADRQAALRISPCHSRQPSIISDASAADGDRSSTPSDINSPRHRTHSLCNSMEDLEDQKRKKKKEKISLGSLSRVFARGKSQRKSLDPGLFDDSDSLSSQNHPSLSDGEEQLERLQQAELTRSKPMSLWRAVTVQAWLEVVMAMPMYMRACSENVKSGKVLLGLTDEDLQLGLGINSPMHRRKLRLAIEDYREAENGRGLSKAADMDHHWVSKTWLSDVGLPQYSQVFHNQLVDGRVLNSITRRDLETIFNVTNKFHVTSILSAIQLLQMLNFDKETIQARRAQCENRDLDPVVWTSHRVIKWIRDIDLKEYADSLQNSGIHGAVMVLDPTFSADTMAKALDIPSNKHMIHRHLYEEMKVLLNPARTNQAQDYRKEGTPTHSPVSNCHKTEEGFSPRQKVGKSPLRFNPLVTVGRDLTFQGGCGSPPREDRIKILQRTKGSPMHGYSSIEITNV